MARRYDEAITQFKNTLQLDPKYAFARQHLLNCYILKGAYSEAYSEYEKLDGSKDRLELALLYSASGRKKEALALLDELTRSTAYKYIDTYDLARGYASLDKEKAFAWLEKAFEMRSVQLRAMKVEPLFDPIRSDSRFQDLLRRMNFPS